MVLQRSLFLSFFVLLLVFSSLNAFAADAFSRLEKLPSGERWFGIFFNDERAGFSYVRIREDRSGYELYSESSAKMAGFGFSRDAAIRETYITNSDLTLRSFAVNQIIDGVPTAVKGESSQAGIKVLIDSGGRKKEKLLKGKGPVYPPMALNFLPLVKGAKTGQVFRVTMLDGEAVKIRKVKITVVGPDTVGGAKTVHLKNDLYPVANDIWVDLDGNTVKESVREGWITTLAEEDRTARKLLSEAALARKDFIVGFSLAGAEERISRPSALKKMTAELSGFPVHAPLTGNAVQKAEKPDGGKVLFTIDNTLASSPHPVDMPDKPGPDDYLKPTDRIPSADPALTAKKTEIVGNESDPGMAIEKLARWVASHVKETSADSASPLETLAKGGGNSLARVRLFTSLARAAGIPTKPVLGITYVPDKGFLYHCWAESYIGRWLPIDLTLGKVPADATHIKLVEGDSDDDLIALSAFVGKIGVKVREQKY